MYFYEGCFESNTYFIILAHAIRVGCWWYGSRGWIFPPISRYMLLPCDRWQKRGTLTDWRLPWKCTWNNVCHWDLPCRTNGTCWHSPTLVNTDRDQTVDVNTVRGGWCIFSSSDSSHLHSYRCLEAWHTALVHHWKKCIYNGGNYVEK